METLAAIGGRQPLGEAAAHVHVLRLEVDTEVELFDGEGRRCRARLTGDDEAELLEELPRVRRTGPTLILGLAKPPATELSIRLATELGARALHFVFAKHSVPRSVGNKWLRFERIAREASRQSERTFVPRLMPPAPLRDVLARRSEHARGMYAWARGGALPERAHTDDWIAIGPEGGWSEEERQTFENASFEPISLGANVLRVPTAVAASLAVHGHLAARPDAK